MTGPKGWIRTAMCWEHCWLGASSSLVEVSNWNLKWTFWLATTIKLIKYPNLQICPKNMRLSFELDCFYVLLTTPCQIAGAICRMKSLKTFGDITYGIWKCIDALVSLSATVFSLPFYFFAPEKLFSSSSSFSSSFSFLFLLLFFLLSYPLPLHSSPLTLLVPPVVGCHSVHTWLLPK